MRQPASAVSLSVLEECRMKKKKVKKAIRTLYDLGSRFEARAERAIAALIKKLRKKKKKR